MLPVDPGLGALGELGEGQLAQVQVLLRVEDSTLQQLLPAHTRHNQLRTETPMEEQEQVCVSVCT